MRRTVVMLRSVVDAPRIFSSLAPEKTDWLKLLRHSQYTSRPATRKSSTSFAHARRERTQGDDGAAERNPT